MTKGREAAGQQDFKELDTLRAELDALRQQAAGAAKKGRPELYVSGALPKPNADELLEMAEHKTSVHGTFNASVADRIGIKDPVPKKQLEVMQRIDENTKRLILEFQRANATFA